MKHNIRIWILLLCIIFNIQADSSVSTYSHTFLTVRPLFQASMPEKISGWRDRGLARKCGQSSALQFVPLGSQSTNTNALGKYFMFYNKNKIKVAGDSLAGLSTDPNLRDVECLHFNIRTADSLPNPFDSIIEFKPKQTCIGIGLDYKQYLHKHFSLEKKWWFEISTPLVYVKNDMQLTETVITSITPAFNNGQQVTNANMIEAFKGERPFFNTDLGISGIVTGSAWNYGKINGSKSNVGLADIEIRVGYDYFCKDKCHAESYMGVIIPTGTRPDAKYVFQPIIGYNFHGAILFGSSIGWQIWSCRTKYLHFEFETQSRYFFNNNQYRSFDVKFKPWSRYMLIYRNAIEANNALATDGINVFTRKCRVNPTFNKDFNFALVFTDCALQAEIGYHSWLRPNERIELYPQFPDGVAFANIDSASGGNITAMINRAITIKENFSDAAQIYNRNLALTQDDIDLGSAATPGSITQTFYASAYYRFDSWKYPLLLGLGGSYEIALSNSTLQRWLVWAKIGVSI